MAETRYVEEYQDGGLVNQIPYEVSDEELYQEALAQEFNDVHEVAIQALQNWDTLTMAQKDTILKHLVKWALWKDDRLHLGVL